MAAEVQACPACGAAQYSRTGPGAVGFSANCGEREFKQPRYSVRECSQCGLLYRTPRLSPEVLSAYYRQVDYHKWEIPALFPSERAVHAQLRRLPRGARILDYGCSSGRLLAPLVREYACYGYEINAPAAAEAARKGLQMVSPQSLNHSAASDFDAVVLVDVFEHLGAPAKQLRALWPLVKPGGLLGVLTGNGDAPVCRLDPAQFWYFRTLEHLCMLTRRHAGFLANELGARLELWQEVCHYDTPLACRLRQHGQHFAYWQFRHETFLARTMLSFLPKLKRARDWPIAPTFTCTRDHVLALFRKDA